MADPNAIRYGGAFVEIFAVLDPLDRDLKKGEKMVHDSAGRMKHLVEELATHLLGPLSIAGAVTAFFHMAEGMHQVQIQAANLDLGLGDFQRFREAAIRGGQGVEILATGIQKMKRTIAEAVAGKPEAIAFFDSLHLSAKDLIQLDPAEAFERLAKAITNVGNSMVQTKLQMELFGRAGKGMRETLKEIAENKGDLDKYVVPDRAAKALGAFGRGAERMWREKKTYVGQSTGTWLDDSKEQFNKFLWTERKAIEGLKGFARGVWDSGLFTGIEEAGQAVLVVNAQIEELESVDRSAALARFGEEYYKKLKDAYEAVGEEAGKNAEAADKLTAKVKDQTAAILGNADALREVRKFLADYEKAQAGLPEFYQNQFAPNVKALRGAVLGFDEAQERKELMDAEKDAFAELDKFQEKFNESRQKAEEKIEADFIKRQEAMADAAQRIWEATRTPLEKYRNTLEEIVQLYSLGFFGGGAVGQRTAGRAGLQAQAEYLSAYDRLHQGRSNWIGGGLAGSADAYRALYGQLYGLGEKNTQQEALAEARVQTRHIEAIRRMMEVVKQVEPQNFPEADL